MHRDAFWDIFSMISVGNWFVCANNCECRCGVRSLCVCVFRLQVAGVLFYGVVVVVGCLCLRAGLEYGYWWFCK